MLFPMQEELVVGQFKLTHYLALTIPAVTVCPMPSGFPIARHTSPTRTRGTEFSFVVGYSTSLSTGRHQAGGRA